MAELVQVPKWKAFDGSLHDTEGEADAHDDSNFASLLVGMTIEEVTGAVIRDPNDKKSVARANAMERAAYLISKKRRAAKEFWRKPSDKVADAENTAPTGAAPEPVGEAGELRRAPETNPDRDAA